MRRLLIPLVAAVLLNGSALAQSPDAQPLPAADFVRKAAIGGLFEVLSSSLAIERTKDHDVMLFAQRMIAEHKDANNALKMTARSVGLDAAVPATVDDAHRAILDDLKSKSGVDFDAAYIPAQSQAHFDAVALFVTYAEKGDDPKLKAFAADAVPKLRAHQDALAHLGAH